MRYYKSHFKRFTSYLKDKNAYTCWATLKYKEYIQLFLIWCFRSFSLSGQSYEVRMLDNRKPGELPELNNKMVKVRGSSQLKGKLLRLTPSTLYTQHGVCLCVEHSASGVP